MKRGDEVVVESWERLSKSTRQLLNYDLMFRNLGVKLSSLKQPVDLDTAFASEKTLQLGVKPPFTRH